MKNNTHIYTKSTVQTICPAQDLKNVKYLYLINKNKNNDYVKEEKTQGQSMKELIHNFKDIALSL